MTSNVSNLKSNLASEMAVVSSLILDEAKNGKKIRLVTVDERKDSSAFTDGSEIIQVPVNFGNVTPELRSVAYGFLSHEASHCRNTDFTVIRGLKEKYGGLAHRLQNVIEDPRIERIAVLQFPGQRQHLNTTKEHVIAQGWWSGPNPQGICWQETLLSYALYWGNVAVGFKCAEPLLKSWENIFNDIFSHYCGETAPDFIREQIKTAVLADQADATALAVEKILDLILANKDKFRQDLKNLPEESRTTSSSYDLKGLYDEEDQQNTGNGNSGTGSNGDNAEGESTGEGGGNGTNSEDASGSNTGSAGSESEDADEDAEGSNTDGESEAGAEEAEGSNTDSESDSAGSETEADSSDTDSNGEGSEADAEETEGSNTNGESEAEGNSEDAEGDNAGSVGSESADTDSNGADSAADEANADEADGQGADADGSDSEGEGTDGAGASGCTPTFGGVQLDQSKAQQEAEDAMQKAFEELQADAANATADNPLPVVTTTNCYNDRMTCRSYIGEHLSDIRNLGLKLKKEFSKKLQDKVLSAKGLKSSGTRFSGSHMAGIATGNYKIFQSKDFVKKPNASVEILLDISGSMYKKIGRERVIEIAQRAVGALLFGLDIQGIETEFSVFPGVYNRTETGYCVVKRFEDRNTALMLKNAYIDADGSTPDAYGVMGATINLSKRKNANKICIVLTDGDICSQTIGIMARGKESGIKYYGIAINTQLPPFIFEKYVEVLDPTNLPEVLLKLAREVIQI